MILNFSISEFVSKMLPAHNRQTNRLALFRWGLSELITVYNFYILWRGEKLRDANVTGSKLALEDYLNFIVSGSGNSIYIEDGSDEGIYLCTESEDTVDFAWLSTATENTDYMWLAKDGEKTSAVGHFIVYAPTGADTDKINEIVNRYLIYGYSFEIILL